MNREESTPTTHLQWWSLAGPLAVFAALLVVVLKAPNSDPALPLIALCGLSLCWIFQNRGLMAALVLLTIWACYQSLQLPIELRLWLAGIQVSIALAFITTVLTWTRYTEPSTSTAIPNAIATLKEYVNALEQTVKDRDQQIENEQAQNTQLKGQLLENSHIFNKQLEECLAQKTSAENLMLEFDKKLFDERASNQQLHDKLLKQSDLYTKQLNQSMKELTIMENVLHERGKQLLMERSHCDHMREQMLQQTQKFNKQHEQSMGQISSFETILSARNTDLERERQLGQELSNQLSEQDRLFNSQRNHWMNQITILEKSVCEREIQIVNEQAKTKGLSEELNEQKKSVNLLQNQYETAQRESQKHLEDSLIERKSLEDKLTQLTQQYNLLQEQLVQAQSQENTTNPHLIEADRALRRSEGMYKQLKSQFADKSALLDETRYRLFHTQEELSSLQRQLQEDTIYDRKPEIKAIERHILLLEKELSRCIQGHQQEVDTLHDLIATLIR